jgi:DNA repair protein RecO (recombination protein O)
LPDLLYKTRAISLTYIRYRETSVIARFFTEAFGLQSFVINGVRSAKSKTPPGLFQPLQLLDIVQYHDEKKELHRLNEVKPASPLKSIPFDHAKTAMAIFVSELLSKVSKEAQANQKLFELAWDWIIHLDEKTTGFESDHIYLLKEMMVPLGIAPENWIDIFPFPGMPGWFKPADALPFFEENVDNQLVTNAVKQVILDAEIHYLGNHLEGLGQIRSLNVLREIFR